MDPPLGLRDPNRSGVPRQIKYPCVHQPIRRRLSAGSVSGRHQNARRQVGKFRPGFLTILRRSPVPVIPVGIAGAHEAMPGGALFIRPRKIRVVIGQPIPPEEFAGLDDHEHERQLREIAFLRVVECQTEAERWRKGV